MTRKELAAKFPQYGFTSLFDDAPAVDLQTSIVITQDGFHKGCYTLHLSEESVDNVPPVTFAPGAIIENIPTWDEANELLPLVKSLAD